MRRRSALLSCVLVACALSWSCNDATEGKEFFEAILSGSEEVPPRATAASGRAGFSFDGTSLTYSVELDNLQNTMFGHIHTQVRGSNGPVRAFLYPGPTVSITGKRIISQGTITAADVTGVSLSDLVAAMRSGGAYVNFHSTLYPGGEVRGQIRQISID